MSIDQAYGLRHAYAPFSRRGNIDQRNSCRPFPESELSSVKLLANTKPVVIAHRYCRWWPDAATVQIYNHPAQEFISVADAGEIALHRVLPHAH